MIFRIDIIFGISWSFEGIHRCCSWRPTLSIYGTLERLYSRHCRYVFNKCCVFHFLIQGKKSGTVPIQLGLELISNCIMYNDGSEKTIIFMNLTHPGWWNLQNQLKLGGENDPCFNPNSTGIIYNNSGNSAPSIILYYFYTHTLSLHGI
jgi:hypothetical protein